MTATPHLDRLSAALLAAGGGGKYLPQSAENMPSSQDDDVMGEAHEHLSRECPWYAKVHGGESAADHEQHCPPRDTGGGALVKFTPRTPEASTVDQPTGRPGGPGLFHMKGHHLPPYIQHLYKHLVGRYGKQKAYGVAVGVVKKWAEGINPGGWKTKSGKGKRTHPDVQAAAARNVAEWEQEKAEAHRRGGEKVRATGPDIKPDLESMSGPDHSKTAADHAMSVAHDVEEIGANLAHAKAHVDALTRKQSPSDRKFNEDHVEVHLDRALIATGNFMDSLRRHNPRERTELKKLLKAREDTGVDLSRSANNVATTPHLAETVAENLVHVKAHLEGFKRAPDDASRSYNLWHMSRHMKVADEHLCKLVKHVKEHYPQATKELDYITDARDQIGLSMPNSGPPPVPDIRYALPASPPKPPKVPLPTAKEVRALIPEVPDGSDVPLTNTVKSFLETAAVKLERNHQLDALTMLRATQYAIVPAHKADVAQAMPAVWAASMSHGRVPAAAQSSARTEMLESRSRTQEWRMLERHVQALADRIRKRYFHGVYQGPSQMARLTDVSALDKVLFLAGQGVVTGQDVSFPTTSDTSRQAKLIQVPGIGTTVLDEEARKELNGLNPLDKVRVNAYLSAASSAGDDSYQARQYLARAHYAARDAGAHYLARCLFEQIRSLQGGMNQAPAGDSDLGQGSGGGDNKDSPRIGAR